jgi:hypothetical protein
MSCGCGDTSITIETPRGREVKLSVIHERLAMCATCSRGEHDGSFWVGGTDRCGVTGRHVLDHASGAPCPRRKFPEGARHVTRWAGLRWYGVPYPIRLVLWALAPGHRSPRRWLECGCIKALKDAWEMMKGVWRSGAWVTQSVTK